MLDKMIKATRKAETPVGGEIFWYPSDPRTGGGDGPRFGCLSSVFQNKLRWGDVWHVVESLREWYTETGVYFGCAFGIEDSIRGNVGSGVVKRGKRVNANPESVGGTASS